MFLLDTNVVSELRSAKRCDARVRAWLVGVSLELCWISVLTLTEIRLGIVQVARRDAAFAQLLEVWLHEKVLVAFAARILPVTSQVADRAGQIAGERTRGLSDCLIAATALEHRLVLVTRNVTDFDDVKGLRVENPWES